MYPSAKRKAFTLIELLVVIAIIAILSVVVILTLNPAQLLAQSRDSNRLSDLSVMNTALGTYVAQGGGSLGSSNTVYVSIPDTVATSSLGDQCQGLGLPPLPGSWTYHCAATSTSRSVDSTGWIPVSFSTLPGGSPLGQLGKDPTNTTSSDLFYTYATNGTQWELTDILESQAYEGDMQTDGGSYQGTYQLGNDLNLTPPFRSYGLVGYWPLDEGTSSTAYDFSGGGNNLTWHGSAVGTSGYYSPGLVYPWAVIGDGSSTYNLSAKAYSISNNEPVSYGGWFYTNSFGSAAATVFAAGGGANAQIGRIFINSTQTISAGFKDSGGTPHDVNSVGYTMPTSTWVNIFVTWDGTTQRLYINGMLNASNTPGSAPGPYNSESVVIISDGSAYQEYNGLASSVRFYDRALSAAEVAAIYNAEN
jgi:prepilin-type N-terminal cleavage/methylation domain-containing protein